MGEHEKRRLAASPAPWDGIDDGKLERGLSVNQMRIGVGADDEGRSIYIHEGLGKASKAKTRAAFGGHVERGIGARARHGGRTRPQEREAQLEAPQGPSRQAEPPLRPANRMRFLLKRFLGSHSGFGRANAQGILDVPCVIANPPENGMEKAA